MDITITIGVATCVKYIVEFLGLVESTTSNSSALRHEPLKSAIALLDEAKRCREISIMQKYLEDARRLFRRAISLETNENKIDALLGVAICQRLLEDSSNAEYNISKIADVKLSISEKVRAIVINYLLNIILPVDVDPYPKKIDYSYRTRMFEEHKKRALNLYNQIG